jgi:hypothetical protein
MRRDISVATKARVRQLANQMGYVPDSLAQGLRTRTTKLLGPGRSGFRQSPPSGALCSPLNRARTSWVTKSFLPFPQPTRKRGKRHSADYFPEEWMEC